MGGLTALGAVILTMGVGFYMADHATPSTPPVFTVEHAEGTNVWIVTDRLTGCQYLETNYGVTTRLDREGKPYCKGIAQ